MPSIQHISREREAINDTIRAFLKGRGYVEVETPLLVSSPGMEPNLSPFETTVVEPDGTRHQAGLITSPEYSMKKLLGLGMERIFTITKVFRNEEELGGTHSPEFTMLEWYQQGADYRACMDETQEMIQQVQTVLRGESAEGGVVQGDPMVRVPVRDLFLTHVGINLDTADTAALREACIRNGIHTSEDDSESDLFYRLFLAKIEPQLHASTFVYDYPMCQAALSRLTSDGKYGERFELYMDGLEICNGFTELTDAKEQRRRFEEEARDRARLGKKVYPIDEEFLALLPSVRTPTFGNALGIDRLHMALTARKAIKDVVLFPSRSLFKDS
ncbi:EF-P lysine aminoacylase GenX [Candidatus Parcubacteria bacterium]|nr:EF-P lysine aminoacylase GenX [Candidatus Parcubacteria bacterium]